MNKLGLLLTAGEPAPGAEYGGLMIVIYLVLLAVFIYFIMYKPQKKEQKRVASMLSEIEIGDSVLTTSGFYGVIIDIADDTVIVEFGNNKNCRIPMQKSAITQVEKANQN